MASSKMVKPVFGVNVAARGVKKGRPGLDQRFNTGIKGEVFSENFNTPLNMENPADPMIDPDEGAPISMGVKGIGLPENPLGIENVEIETISPKDPKMAGSKYKSGRGR